METLKVAMLGGWSSAIAFKAVGVETHILSATDDPLGAWESLSLEKYAMIIMTEPVYEALRRQITGFPSYEGLPVILAIPPVTGSLGTARTVIRDRVVKALGSVIEG
ncbi:MAG: hypothetical protein A2Y75_04430 [Candidatus Solincola sediminis]|uniref:V-type ATP synthase subunit F n=1 Tax=Candidatus Solincola sediminis TaxID=1797199 RepID=A0A1F2WGL7_9ACTN|nr:MAG: hypothetical protein A2Y75_04430 [Candidatus Solincola sediminis]